MEHGNSFADSYIADYGDFDDSFDNAQGNEYSLSREAMRDQLDAARRDWAAMSAKRQRRLFDWRIHGYNKARETYESLLEQCQKLDLEEALENEPDETQRRLMVAEYWLDEQNTLREQTKATVEGKKTWKFANAISTFMNSGSLRMRIAKGIAIGAGIGIVGTLVSGVAGAAIVGGGIVMGGKFARGYLARHKGGIEQHDMTAEELYSQIASGDMDDEQYAQAVRQESSEMFNKAGKKEQNKQRVAFAWGAGSVAVGAALGWGFASGNWGGVTVAHADTISTAHSDVVSGGYGHSDILNTGTSVQHADVYTADSGANHTDVTGSDVNMNHADVTKTGTATMHADINNTDAGAAHADITKSDIGNTHADVVKTDAGHDHSDITQTGVNDNGHADVTKANAGTSHTDITRNETGTPHTDIDKTGSKPYTFTVEKGHGLAREIHEYAEHLGYKNISSEDSYKIYKVILQAHGKDGIIDVHSISHDTYLHGADVRISAPGEASWRSGVSEDLNKLFQAHQNGGDLSSYTLDHDVAGGHVDITATGDATTPNATAADISNAHLHTDGLDSHSDITGRADAATPNATAYDIAHANHTDVTTSNATGNANPVELWKGAPTERVLQKLYGTNLNDREAYRAINELYDKFGSKGVFKGLSLTEHAPNNIWINENHGQVKLTKQAYEYLQQHYGKAPLSQSYYDLAA